MNKLLSAIKIAFMPASRLPIPRLTGSELTMLSWSLPVNSIAEAPEVYRKALGALANHAAVFPYTIHIPTYGNWFHRDRGKLLCSLDDRLYLLEGEKNQVTTTCYPIEGLSYLEMGTVLLLGWITLRGMTGDGRLATSTLVYNTVTSYLFEPVVQKIRGASRHGWSGDPQVELRKFDYLVKPHYKFMNYGRRSILPDERVVDTLLQLEIRERVLGAFGKSLNLTLAPAHLLILTDRELILLREENQSSWRSTTRYGGVWDYIPLEKICSAAQEERGDGRLLLTIHLPGGDQLEALFSSAVREELGRFIKKLNEARQLPQAA